MSKSKNYDRRKEDKEDLHGEIRRLKKQVKSLTRENARLNKDMTRGKTLDVSEEEVDVKPGFIEIEQKTKCEKCGSTSFHELEVPARSLTIFTCRNCPHRWRTRSKKT